MMKREIKVPAMGESINEATIGAILKPNGSVVKVDDEILELETDKVNQVIYAPSAGVLNLSVKQDQVVKIGDSLGFIEESDTALATAPKSDEAPKLKPKEAAVNEPKSQQEGLETARVSVASFIEEVKTEKKPAFSAPLSEPTEQTSERPKDRPVAGAREESRKRLPKIRKVIAERLLESKQTTAMLTTFNEIDMSAVLELREKYKDGFLKQQGVKLGFMSFFVKAAISALKAVPSLNSLIDGDEWVQRHYYDIGVAIGTERGLIVPVIKDADGLNFAGIEKKIEEYARQARDGTISLSDLQGGCFTVTNGGTYGSLLSTPILNPPQSGILGMHKIEKRAVVINDEIVIRPMMYVALSYDHRVVDGKDAVTFLVHVKNVIEDPSRLLLEV